MAVKVGPKTFASPDDMIKYFSWILNNQTVNQVGRCASFKTLTFLAHFQRCFVSGTECSAPLLPHPSSLPALLYSLFPPLSPLSSTLLSLIFSPLSSHASCLSSLPCRLSHPSCLQ